MLHCAAHCCSGLTDWIPCSSTLSQPISSSFGEVSEAIETPESQTKPSGVSSWNCPVSSRRESLAAVRRWPFRRPHWLAALSSCPSFARVVSLPPNPTVRDEIMPPLAGLDNVMLVEPLRYAEFARLLQRATLVLTDSGGIREGSPSLGTPVLVAREETERVEGVEAGAIKLVGTDRERIVEEALCLLNNNDALSTMRRARNPYGDG